MTRARSATIPWAGGRARGPRVKGYQRTRVGDEVFDSKAEARRWRELKLLEAAGAIRGLRRQVRYALCCPAMLGPVIEIVCEYVADFVYEERGTIVVEDCKGHKTDVYNLKKRWMKKQLGIVIRETMPARAPRRRRRG